MTSASRNSNPARRNTVVKPAVTGGQKTSARPHASASPREEPSGRSRIRRRPASARAASPASRPANAPRTSWASSSQLSALTMVRQALHGTHELHDARCEQDHEHGRENKADEWNEHFDRSFASLFLCLLPTPDAQLLSLNAQRFREIRAQLIGLQECRDQKSQLLDLRAFHEPEQCLATTRTELHLRQDLL